MIKYRIISLLRGEGTADWPAFYLTTVLSAAQQLTRHRAYEAFMTIATICHHTAQWTDHDRASLFLGSWTLAGSKCQLKPRYFSRWQVLSSCSGLTESTLYGAIRLVLRAICSSPGMCLFFTEVEVLILIRVQYESGPWLHTPLLLLQFSLCPADECIMGASCHHILHIYSQWKSQLYLSVQTVSSCWEHNSNCMLAHKPPHSFLWDSFQLRVNILFVLSFINLWSTSLHQQGNITGKKKYTRKGCEWL